MWLFKYFTASLKIVIFFLILIFLHASVSAIDYSNVDKHALSAPKDVEQNLLSLTNYLVSPFKSEKDKIRSIFRWITENIEYDIHAYLNKSFSAIDPDEVLKKRKCVCEGYARLFKRMTNIAGFESDLVGGNSKGYNYEIGKLFSDQNSHAWSAVKINGQWRLLDATWGAGYIDKNKRFVKSFNEYYFLTPPKELIQSHYPLKARWQLLERKKTRQEFENSVYIKSAFFIYGLKIDSHEKLKINADSLLKITLKGPEDVQLVSRLIYGNTELNSMFTFEQRYKDKFEINVVFPESETYLLRVFAKRKTDPNIYQWILDYYINVKNKSSGTVGFPDKYSSFEDFNAYLFYPLNKFLKPETIVKFKLYVEDVEEVAIISNEKLNILKRNGNIFSGDVFIHKGETIIAAKLPNDNHFSYLLKFGN